jgi:prolyl-tRNA synthetase
MRMSKLYLPTLKENPVEAEIASHQLMLRAGLIRSLTAGVYTYLPLGYRVIKKIENIVRQAMDQAGAQEILMPIIHTAELWQESGRWGRFGPLMIKFKDRKDREYCLGPTHEEVITDLIRNEIRSYKDLPFNLYQIQTKVRDEIRPRFGVIRCREFIMKDAYSFDRDSAGLDLSYQAMYNAYIQAFTACGLEFRIVDADSGAMGGKGSHEFMVLADAGEDEIAICQSCDYAANLEKATAAVVTCDNTSEKPLTLKKVSTPGAKTIDSISSFLNIEPARAIKSLGLLADGEPVLVLLRGDDRLNEIKLKNFLNVLEINQVSEEDFAKYFHSVSGFIGPVGMKNVKIIADLSLKSLVNAVTGANEQDYHYINVNPGRDFKVDQYIDLRTVKSGDRCPYCGGTLEIKSGIEIGHIFKLGTRYSESLEATYLDQEGREQFIVMGCYGIGITRLVAAAIEQHHDKDGIIWPGAIAPYQVIIIPLGKEANVREAAEELYSKLSNNNLDVLIDDRDERAGVKFNDADLIGIPLRLTIGSRSLQKGIVEARVRHNNYEVEIPYNHAPQEVLALLENEVV